MIRIKEVRVKNNLTREQLATKSGISPSMIGNYEKGTSDITLSKLLDIAKALNVSFTELVVTDEMQIIGNNDKLVNLNNSNSLPLEQQNIILEKNLSESNKIIKALQLDRILRLDREMLNLRKDYQSDISELGNSLDGLEAKYEKLLAQFDMITKSKNEKDSSSNS